MSDVCICDRGETCCNRECEGGFFGGRRPVTIQEGEIISADGSVDVLTDSLMEHGGEELAEERYQNAQEHIVSDTEECWCEPRTEYVGMTDPTEDAPSMRAFDTGATRNVEKDPDLYGFTSPLALGLFGEYMHRNRTQADGTIRDSDNWKRGIPLDSYMRSMRRHMQDLTLHFDGYPELAREDLEAALCGLFFNVQGFMHEVVKQGIEEQRLTADAETFYGCNPT